MGLFKKKDKNEEEFNKDNKESKKDKKNKDESKEVQNVNTNKVRIVIWRYVGEDLAVQVGKPITAEEKKDENNNLLAINNEAMIKEDLNFSIDRIYEIMNYSLKLQNKTNKEKAGIISKEIKKQEELILEIENDPDLNAKYNFPDEEQKLKQLKIFYDSLRKEKRGNYMRLGEGGIRQYEFVSIDGILYPYFFGSKRFRVYPDLLVKKKIFNHENTVFKSETAALFNNSINWITVILLSLGVLLTIINLGVGYWMWDKSSDIDRDVNQGAITCLDALGYMAEKTAGLQQSQDNTKTQSNINNKVPNINIDPNKILNNN